MLHCRLLKEFHQKYNNFISLADEIRDMLVTKGTHSTCNMGGSSDKFIVRFRVHDDSVAIQIGGPNSSLIYYSCFSNSANYNTFYSTNATAEIEFGNPEIKDEFIIGDIGTVRTMEYPISEAEYFQNLTVFELNDEEVYQYFMELNIDHFCNIQLTTIGEGIDELVELLNDKTAMNELFFQIKLVSTAYKKTNGLK